MIGKSWGQGAQHSQGLYPLFMNIPGLKVVAPTTPHDAKGALLAAIADDNPVMFVEHRLLHFTRGQVPESQYTSDPGFARIARDGNDVTIVGISYMQHEAMQAASILERAGVDAEVIDPVWLAPLDIRTIAESTKRTGRLLVIDNGWMTCGASAEIITAVMEHVDVPVQYARMGFAPTICPTTPGLEALFYPNPQTIAQKAHLMATGRELYLQPEPKPAEPVFKGPF